MRFILGLALFGFGYALAYYGANILVDAYLRTTPMNPAPLSVLLGIPGAPTSQAAGTPAGASGPGDVPALLGGTGPQSQAPSGGNPAAQILNPGGG